MPTPHDYTSAQAADPGTPLETLADIAHLRPDLRSLVAENPSTYPALREWIAQQTSPAPAPQRRSGAVIALIAVSALVLGVGAAAVAIPLLTGQNQTSFSSSDGRDDDEDSKGDETSGEGGISASDTENTGDVIKEVTDDNGVTVLVHEIECTDDVQRGPFDDRNVLPDSGMWCVIPITYENNGSYAISADRFLEATLGNIGQWTSTSLVSTINGQNMEYLIAGSEVLLAEPGEKQSVRYFIDVTRMTGYLEIQTNYFRFDSAGDITSPSGFVLIDVGEVSSE